MSMLLAAGVLAAAAGILVQTQGLHFRRVLSGSMRPALSPGDLAVTQTAPIGSIRVGDVIVFLPPGGSEAVIHRVVSLADGAVTTKGDGNSVADPWRLRGSGPEADRLVAVVPFAGWLAGLQTPLLALAVSLVAAELLLRLWKEVRSRTRKPLPDVDS